MLESRGESTLRFTFVSPNYLQYYATMQLIQVSPEEVFQSLSDPIRLRVVRLLASTGEEACLCELVDSFLEPSYKVSRHLKVLRQSGVVSVEKEGRWVYHSLVAGPDHLAALFNVVEGLPDPNGIFEKDLERFLQRLGQREDGRCRVGLREPAGIQDRAGGG